MTDPSREEEHVTLLGEEGLRAGGQQSLKLGYDFINMLQIYSALVAYDIKRSLFINLIIERKSI